MPRVDIEAAGGVVTRPGKQVLLVHRPKYDDWSFPKGKLDPGEHAVAAAVREVAEETGLDVRLGPPLPSQTYQAAAGLKRVHYWTARAIGPDEVSGYTYGDEIDEVRWLGFDEAEELLTYPHDRETLTLARRVRRRSRPLVVLRHASARSRKSWPKDDRLRTLTPSGELQADRLVPLLAAYDVNRLISSSSTRCLQTIEPFSDVTGISIKPTDDLTEEAFDADRLADLVGDLLATSTGSLVCTHRPVLPDVFDALALEPVELQPGGFLVAHHRKGSIVASEVHQNP